MITSYDIPAICQKLIGHISAIGETNYDTESYNNLDEVDNLLKYYLDLLLYNERRKNVPEYSIGRITDKSNWMLNEYREMLKD